MNHSRSVLNGGHVACSGCDIVPKDQDGGLCRTALEIIVIDVKVQPQRHRSFSAFLAYVSYPPVG